MYSSTCYPLLCPCAPYPVTPSTSVSHGPCFPVYLCGPGCVSPRRPSTPLSCCPTPAPQCYLSPFATVATARPLTVFLDTAPGQGPVPSPTLPCPPVTHVFMSSAKILFFKKSFESCRKKKKMHTPYFSFLQLVFKYIWNSFCGYCYSVNPFQKIIFSWGELPCYRSHLLPRVSPHPMTDPHGTITCRPPDPRVDN